MSSSSAVGEDVPLLIRILATSAAASLRACAFIRQVMASGQLDIVVKGHNDLQTAADRGAQRIIVGNLRAAIPGLTVIGEEDEDPEAVPLAGDELTTPLADILARGGECPSHLAGVALEDVTVWVDPLDGTSEFADNLLDHVTVLVGIAVGKRALAGVICQPYFNYQSDPDHIGRLIWSLDGLGVFGLDVGDLLAPPGNIIATTRSHSNQVVNDAVAACEPTEVLRVGGCGHKVLLLIERKAHAYVFASPGCKKWDTCAPEAVLRALGGCLTDIHGNELPYHAEAPRGNKQGVLATLRNDDHAKLAAKIPDSVRKSLA